MDTLYNQKVIEINQLFDGYFLDSNMVYLYFFNRLPSVCFNDRINIEKAFEAFASKFGHLVERTHSYRSYILKHKYYNMNKVIMILKNNCLVQFEGSCCEILHDGSQHDFVHEMTTLIHRFKQKQRRQPLEINLIVQAQNALELKAMEVKRTRLELDLFYGDDFIKTDELIRSRLNKNNDKGIVLLHGVPGSGKTSYLRYLVGKIKKKILFLSPSVAGDLMNPNFIELLISNPNSVLIIEDAENIIMDRKQNSSSAVSNLLNISDGLLADFLNVQLICTFNSSLTLIDSALMRKGRLIAKHEFGKLSQPKAQRLSNHFGFKTIIDKPMTIAEISNQHEVEFQSIRKDVIGFRTQTIEN